MASDAPTVARGRRRLRRLGLAVLLAAAMGPWLSACEDEPRPPKPTAGRADAVTAKPPASATPRARPTVTGTATPAKRRALCAGQGERDEPEAISHARAVAGARTPGPLRYGAGRWVWVNVWAAWCKPCKEEMPLLLSWQPKLGAAGARVELAFVSIDDDEREMMRFLESQPPRGVRASYWLEGEEEREKWFASVGFDEVPELPIQALVAPSGKLACVIKGAVEPADYVEIAALLAPAR